jgi:hypothetical protein
MTAADAVMLVALASTVLSVDLDAARTRVLLYQMTTLAPFTVIAPLIGPMVDRLAGGRRFVIQAAALARIFVSLLLASALHSLFLYPLALLALIIKQTYVVSKSALVPSVTSSEADLVEANSKLGVIAGIAALVVVAPAALLQVISDRATLVASAFLFAVALFYATKLPREVVAAKKPDRLEQAELRSPPIVLGASAMALLRASVGFLQFHLFFVLRAQGADAWFGAAIAIAAGASMVGNAIGPRLRSTVREELMLVGSLALAAAAGVACALTGGRVAAVVLLTAVTFASSLGKLAFDSIVQRDAPEANQGRAFAQFESKFQLAWVLGAIVPVIWTPPDQAGYVVVGAIAAFGVVTYLAGMRQVRLGKPVPLTISQRAGREIKRRIEERRTPSGGSPRPNTNQTPGSGPVIVSKPNVPPPGARKLPPPPATSRH